MNFVWFSLSLFSGGQSVLASGVLKGRDRWSTFVGPENRKFVFF